MRANEQAGAIFAKDLAVIAFRTDRMFFWLLLGQWAAAVIIALVWSPRTWIAQYWSVHQHVVAAVVLGGLFAVYPLYMIVRHPGSRATRHVIAVGQMLQSALLVHVTGGRIETHFHVFGSLALLAFYRDWPVLLTAGVVVYADHLALGAWFPLSAYGVPAVTIWRSIEHGFWVIFEAVFLTMACRTGIRELRQIADRHIAISRGAAELKDMNEQLEVRVATRTQELQRANENLEQIVDERTRELRAAKTELELQVRDRTKELAQTNETLKQKVRELELLNQVMWGREERILELKREINDILDKTHATPRYELNPGSRPVA
jgi:hypothetical protein